MNTDPKLQQLKDWKKNDDDILRICLGVDIGGSGLRIRLSNALDSNNDDYRYVDLDHMRAKSTNDVHQILTSVATELEGVVSNFVCVGAALAVAGPISDGRVVLTNWPGDPSDRTIVVEELPQILCPKECTVLLNDLEAGAYGVVAASLRGSVDNVFEQMWTEVGPSGPIVSDHRTAVCAMGSGLGVALIVKSGMLAVPLVLPTECGHIQIPPNCDQHHDSQLEDDLLQHISNHYYNGTQHPEYKDIASGRGLPLVYQFFVERETGEYVPIESLDAGIIASNAKKGSDNVARLALLWHYKMFVRGAKAIATAMCCDSVVLALDSQVKNSSFVQEISDELKDEFYHFIRPDWMNGIRVYAQRQMLNFNVIGTDYMAHRLASQ
jgi:glucokinase